MILKNLSLTNYKNIESCNLTFSDKLNCIIGDNGMGKTNLLDSIYYLSFTKTHLHLPDSMVIRKGESYAILQGQYEVRGDDVSINIGLSTAKAKVIKRNRKRYERIADHIGQLPIVMIAPSDIDLIRGGSVERRKFMNQLISQESNPYLTAVMHYDRLLSQRNALLKNKDFIDLPTLHILDEQMATEAEVIVRYRSEWTERMRPIFLSYYEYITETSDAVDIAYSPSLTLEDGRPTVREDFLAAWQATFQTDRYMGFTTIGPHKDDLEMLLDGTLIRKIGSQGQNKSYMIALKLAQFELLAKLYPDNKPLLLLDDVFDKLDEKRVDRIVHLVSSEDFGQIFMTDTNRKYLDQIIAALPETGHTIVTVDHGVPTVQTEE